MGLSAGDSGRHLISITTMARDSQQLSFQVALYVNQGTSHDIQTQTLKAIAWNVQEDNVNLKDLVRSLRELNFISKRVCYM